MLMCDAVEVSKPNFSSAIVLRQVFGAPACVTHRERGGCACTSLYTLMMPESMRAITAVQERSNVGETFAKARGG